MKKTQIHCNVQYFHERIFNFPHIIFLVKISGIVRLGTTGTRSEKGSKMEVERVINKEEPRNHSTMDPIALKELRPNTISVTFFNHLT